MELNFAPYYEEHSTFLPILSQPI